MSTNCFLVISGPNLNLLGCRETSIYGGSSLEDIHQALQESATAMDLSVDCFQFNLEGDIVDCLQGAPEKYSGVIINAGALAHDSYTLRSAIGSLLLPCIEVFISNMDTREEFRHHSVIAPVCLGVIGGFGKQSYVLALEALANLSNQ